MAAGYVETEGDEAVYRCQRQPAARGRTADGGRLRGPALQQVLVDRDHVLDRGGERVLRRHAVVDGQGGDARPGRDHGRFGDRGVAAVQDVAAAVNVQEEVVRVPGMDLLGRHSVDRHSLDLGLLDRDAEPVRDLVEVGVGCRLLHHQPLFVALRRLLLRRGNAGRRHCREGGLELLARTGRRRHHALIDGPGTGLLGCRWLEPGEGERECQAQRQRNDRQGSRVRSLHGDSPLRAVPMRCAADDTLCCRAAKAEGQRSPAFGRRLLSSGFARERVRRPAYPEIRARRGRDSVLQPQRRHRARLACSRTVVAGTAALWVRGSSDPLPQKAANWTRREAATILRRR